MATIPADRLRELLGSYEPEVTPLLVDQLSVYLDLLLRWNARTNLSAIRDPEEIVRRHFGESLFAARQVGEAETLLDLGSGAGFPGLPIALARPALRVTLAESQNKKATFLREVVRTLGASAEVWAARVEQMPVGRRFDVVTLRAVDRPELALSLADKRVIAGGRILHLTSGLGASEGVLRMPGSRDGVVQVIQR